MKTPFEGLSRPHIDYGSRVEELWIRFQVVTPSVLHGVECRRGCGYAEKLGIREKQQGFHTWAHERNLSAGRQAAVDP